jgi:hypothetical protein
MRIHVELIYEDMKPGSQSNIRYAVWERKDRWRRVHRGTLGTTCEEGTTMSISARVVE